MTKSRTGRLSRNEISSSLYTRTSSCLRKRASGDISWWNLTTAASDENRLFDLVRSATVRRVHSSPSR